MVSVSSGCNGMGPSNGLLITQSAAATLSDRRYTLDTHGGGLARDRGLTRDYTRSLIRSVSWDAYE